MLIAARTIISAENADSYEELQRLKATAEFLLQINRILKAGKNLRGMCTVNFIDDDFVILAIKAEGIDGYTLFSNFDTIPWSQKDNFIIKARIAPDHALSCSFSNVMFENSLAVLTFNVD